MSVAAKNPRPLAGRGQGVGGVPKRRRLQENEQCLILKTPQWLNAPLPLPLPRKGEGGASLGDAA